MTNSSRQVYWPSVLICIALYAYIVLMSLSAIWIGDDITYQFSFSTQGALTSLRDVFSSQLAHYHTMNGRFLAHFIVQVMLVFVGKTGFALLNGVMWILLIALLMRLLGKEWTDWRMLGTIAILSIVSFPTKYVPTCQIGYIWMFDFVLVWLLAFRHFSHSGTNAWHLLWLIPFSILAGWTQEALVVGVSAALIVYMLCNWRKASLAQWTMFVFFGLGAMLLCFSPATLSRTGEVHASVDFLPGWALSLVRCALYLRLAYLLVIEIIVIKARNHVSWKELYRDNSFLWNAWAVLIVFNILVGVFGNRQLFGVELISLILIVRYFTQYILSRTVAFAVMGILAIAVVALSVRNIRFLKEDRLIYASVIGQFKSNSDGTVFYDLKSRNVTFKESYPSDVFTWYTEGTIERLLHSQGEPEEKHLTILPTEIENLDSECSLHNAEGSTLVVVEKSDIPSAVTLAREFRFLGIRIPFKQYSLPMDYPIFENGSVKVFQTWDKVPLLHITEAQFVR